jgi:hypothetical protein
LQDVIRQAEEQLKGVSVQPGYTIAVLKVIHQLIYQPALLAPAGSGPALMPTSCWCMQVIVAGDAVGVDVRLAAAVNFKNTVKYRWVSGLRLQPAQQSALWLGP